jgi:hypothetical protein
MGWLFSKLLARFALLVCNDAGDAPPASLARTGFIAALDNGARFALRRSA